MTILALVEAVAVVATVLLCLRHVSRLEAAWADERRELLNRIQRPEVLPVKAADGFVVPDREPDEWNLIGTVGFDPEYGTE